MKGSTLTVLAMLAGMQCVPASGAGPGNAPATSPSGGSSASTADGMRQRLTQWLRDLADDRPRVREEARINLMGISRSDLGILRDLVAEKRPLQLSQAGVLREIVTHVYLRGEPYTKSDAGFLGVRFEEVSTGGARVGFRWLGSCAFSALQEGDVVTRIEPGKPAAAASRTPRAELPGPVDIDSPAEVLQTVSNLSAGTLIVMVVQRRGRILRVPITLDARPVDPEDPSLQALGEQRTEDGEAYWEKEFAPLVDGPLSAAGTGVFRA